MTDKSNISRSPDFTLLPVCARHNDWAPDNQALLTVRAQLDRVAPAEYDGGDPARDHGKQKGRLA
ncbi:hypothetical protein [Parasphingorhabdus halotolerans]|uniref:hypothetical protein n=1 Tax=Parasphingorhabdus halotolerans TaxID=2725558 RepID=UPI001B3A5A04|nr:hypothetical protein [Parasphingorhabdus halotolerans]